MGVMLVWGGRCDGGMGVGWSCVVGGGMVGWEVRWWWDGSCDGGMGGEMVGWEV